CLAPRAAGPQGLGGIERDLRRRELAVGLDRVGGGSAGRPAGNLLVERACKTIELGTLERQSRGHGVTAEALDELGVTRRDRAEPPEVRRWRGHRRAGTGCRWSCHRYGRRRSGAAPPRRRDRLL